MLGSPMTLGLLSQLCASYPPLVASGLCDLLNNMASSGSLADVCALLSSLMQYIQSGGTIPSGLIGSVQQDFLQSILENGSMNFAFSSFPMNR
jgi:hypothetical protein